MKLFVTGGAGYIGSHALDEVRRLTGRDLQLVEGNLLDDALLTASLRHYAPEAVVRVI